MKAFSMCCLSQKHRECWWTAARDGPRSCGSEVKCMTSVERSRAPRQECSPTSTWINIAPRHVHIPTATVQQPQVYNFMIWSVISIHMNMTCRQMDTAPRGTAAAAPWHRRRRAVALLRRGTAAPWQHWLCIAQQTCQTIHQHSTCKHDSQEVMNKEWLSALRRPCPRRPITCVRCMSCQRFLHTENRPQSRPHDWLHANVDHYLSNYYQQQKTSIICR